jgi:multidrug efflux pump subunit AcrA (membrane-fusion protein)
VGRLNLPEPDAISLPWTALTAMGGSPAVWTVDPATMVVHQTPVTVSAYGAATFRLAGGIAPGTWVVTDGAQLLYPDRTVVVVKESQ